MGQRKMYNFPFVEDGQTYWRSRSCTVVGYIFCRNKNGDMCILANQRGSGAPTCQGMWNVPCGYIDFSESGEEAVVREIFEETGVKLEPKEVRFDSVSFSKDGDQNINLRYLGVISNKRCEDFVLTDENSEPNEVADIQWIRIADYKDYNWAFGQDKTIGYMYCKVLDELSYRFV